MPYDDTNDNAIIRDAKARLLQFSRHILEFENQYTSDNQKLLVVPNLPDVL